MKCDFDVWFYGDYASETEELSVVEQYCVTWSFISDTDIQKHLNKETSN